MMDTTPKLHKRITWRVLLQWGSKHPWYCQQLVSFKVTKASCFLGHTSPFCLLDFFFNWLIIELTCALV